MYFTQYSCTFLSALSYTISMNPGPADMAAFVYMVDPDQVASKETT